MSRISGTYARPWKLYLLPPIPEDVPAVFKNALALRNQASTAGVCPSCGARGELTGPDSSGFLHLTFRHEDSCGALLDPGAAA